MGGKYRFFGKLCIDGAVMLAMLNTWVLLTHS